MGVWEDPGDWGIILREDVPVTHHGTPNVYAMTYLDGHADILYYDTNDPYNPKHTVLFMEQQKR